METALLDFDFTTLLSQSYNDFSSHSSDSDTIFSSPVHSPFAEADVSFPFEFPTLSGTLFSNPTSVKQEPATTPYNDSTSTQARKVRGKRRKIDNHTESALLVQSELRLGDSLVLSREELLTLSSSQYEVIVSRVRSQRELTANEKRDVKRQRRLIKNRESAQASRQRKKNYIEELERKLAILSNKNEQLKQVQHALKNENSAIKAENECIKNALNVSTKGISSVLNRGATFIYGRLNQQEEQQQRKSHNESLKLSPKSSGVVLMVLLFSFGLMFGNLGFSAPKKSSSSFDTIEDTPATRMLSNQEHKHKEFKKVSFESSLPTSDVPMRQEDNTVSETMRERLQQTLGIGTLGSPAQLWQKQQMQSLQHFHHLQMQQLQLQKLQFQKLQQHQLQQFQAPPLQQQQQQQQQHQQQQQQQQHQQQRQQMCSSTSFHPSFWKPNTTYLMCDKMDQLQPPLSAHMYSPNYVNNDPHPEVRKILFLIPPTTFGDNPIPNQQALLSVTCQVNDVSMIPL